MSLSTNDLTNMSNHELVVICFDSYPSVYEKLKPGMPRFETLRLLGVPALEAPSELLIDASLFREEDRPSRQSSLHQNKIEVLKERLDGLLKEYRAANKQANNTLDAAARTRIQRQISDLEAEISEVESQLQDMRDQQRTRSADINTSVRVKGRITPENSDIISRAIKGEYTYAMLGLSLGLAAIIGGVILGINGVAGSTSWTASLFGLQSELNDATPGVILFVVGLFMVRATKPKVDIRDLNNRND